MTDVKKALANKQNNSVKKAGVDMQAMLSKMGEQIKIALPNDISSERFRRVVLTAFNSNKKLQECKPMSFISAMMQSAQLGLEPNTPLGEAYLIPYGNEVNFQIGYQGLLNLAYRSGEYQTIVAREVCENDEFSLDYGLEEIKHIPNLRGERGEVYGYYAKYITKDGQKAIYYISKEEALKYAKRYSKSFNRGPWQSDFDAMAKKTAIKQLLKYAPKTISSEKLTQAVAVDNTNIKGFESDKETKITNFDFEYIPENVDSETGEILEENTENDKNEFFGEDFKPVSEKEL